ncbi:type I secretion system permease/ATPase [Shewanella olleyana]|uniref:type I secretion system permease/ATPase n=1 Tax=Shewanella olleyana TaxID=135626 RepID=UPI00200D78C7|nr:type I secretion system permease/ATPase [Shewanella olleyana]MCL1068445.1 type I secretion system permease/ATPase [Shewanella olleyana]
MSENKSTTQQVSNNESLISLLSLIKEHFGLPITLENLSQIVASSASNKNMGALAEQVPQLLKQIQIDSASQAINFKHIALPAVLIDQTNQVYFAIEKQQGALLLVDTQGQHTQLDESQFADQFSIKKAQQKPQCWYIKPIEQLDERGTEHHKDNRRHWLLAAFDEVKPFYGSFLIGSLAINMLALVTPLFTMNVYDRVVPNQAIDTLWVLASGASIAIVFDWLLRQARTRLADVAGKQVDIKLSSTLFEKVIGMRLENRPASSGAFAKQLQEFDSIRDFITSVTLVTAVDLPFTLLFLLLIAWLGGVMVFVPLTCMVVLILLSVFMQKRLSVTIEESSKLSTQRQAHLVESLNMLAEIKQNNGQAKASRIWNETVSSLADWQNESRISSNTLSHSVMNCQQLVSIGLIITGVYQIHQGNLSMGGLIAIVMLSGRASSAINQIAMLLLKYQQTRSAITSVESILELPQENQHQSLNVAQFPFNGSLNLRSASFSYPEQPLSAFNDVSLEIKAGEKVGFYGPAGAGKSTLMALIAGQYQLSEGQLFYNQLEAQQWSVARLREHIGYMGQQPSLVYGTVLDNLLYGIGQVDETLLAKTMMSTGIDKLMDRLGSGLNSQVGEFGRQLSGGQRQAIALCRTLLRQPTLLILDEPTSAMDERSENQIISSLKANTQDCTLLISSHNPKVLSLCDRIIVMDKGVIIGEKSASELLEPTKRRIKAVSVKSQSDRHADNTNMSKNSEVQS